MALSLGWLGYHSFTHDSFPSAASPDVGPLCTVADSREGPALPRLRGQRWTMVSSLEPTFGSKDDTDLCRGQKGFQENPWPATPSAAGCGLHRFFQLFLCQALGVTRFSASALTYERRVWSDRRSLIHGRFRSRYLGLGV